MLIAFLHPLNAGFTALAGQARKAPGLVAVLSALLLCTPAPDGLAQTAPLLQAQTRQAASPKKATGRAAPKKAATPAARKRKPAARSAQPTRSSRGRVSPAAAATTATAAAATTVAIAAPKPPIQADGVAEQRLLEVLELTSTGQTEQALAKAQALVRDYPNFQLAQLTLGDLLLARAHPLHELGNAQAQAHTPQAAEVLQDLRAESWQRVAAQKAALPVGAVPQQFLQVPPSSRHAIAVDASFSRLYLFENTAQGLRLVADYYASVGKLGIEKEVEGDQRTPLGVYFVTSKIQAKALPPFYGAGALPLNYPNPLDLRRGKTGHGIWLHGTPPDQFARAPQATDGCVALADPDFARLLSTVDVRTTPVVIAKDLQWVQPQSLDTMRQAFDMILDSWHQAKTAGDMGLLLSFYAPDFQGSRKINLANWSQQLSREVKSLAGRSLELKDRSYLRWSDEDDVMVVTFGEVAEGSRTGPTRRQYWRRNGSYWQIFFESTV